MQSSYNDKCSHKLHLRPEEGQSTLTKTSSRQAFFHNPGIREPNLFSGYLTRRAAPVGVYLDFYYGCRRYFLSPLSAYRLVCPMEFNMYVCPWMLNKPLNNSVFIEDIAVGNNAQRQFVCAAPCKGCACKHLRRMNLIVLAALTL